MKRDRDTHTDIMKCSSNMELFLPTDHYRHSYLQIPVAQGSATLKMHSS